jgi:hypothetical protein
MTSAAYLVFGALAALLTTAGYLVGLRRFARQAAGELDPREHALEAPSAGPPAHPRLAGLPIVVHAVVLDGATHSGKRTWLSRIAQPWLDRPSRDRIDATQRAYRTRPLPVGFEWPAGAAAEPTALHALRFHDISGEQPEGVADHIGTLANQRRPGDRSRAPSSVVAVLIWDLSDPGKSREHSTIKRLRLAYDTRKARPRIHNIVVFFNKIDLLPPADVARRIAFETEHIRGITGFLGDDVRLTFVAGSALDGRGVIDCYGAILARLGLGELLQPLEEDRA